MFDENKNNYQQFQPETGHFEMEWINNVLGSDDNSEQQEQLQGLPRARSTRRRVRSSSALGP